jgi:hypothetical protein
MADIQKLQLDEPLPPPNAERESGEVNEAPPVKQLDGEITRLEEIPFAGGTYCEVWVGRWVKEVGTEKPGGREAGREKTGGEKTDGEKVSFNLVTSILPTRLFVGGLESTPNNQIAREGT